MVTRRYVPERGDLVGLTFDPQAGRKQAGRRSASVLSPASYNRPAGLAVVGPITSQTKGYPFEVSLPEGLPVSGVVLADHLKSVDGGERRAESMAKPPAEVAPDVLAKIAPLLGLSS